MHLSILLWHIKFTFMFTITFMHTISGPFTVTLPPVWLTGRCIWLWSSKKLVCCPSKLLCSDKLTILCCWKLLLTNQNPEPVLALFLSFVLFDKRAIHVHRLCSIATKILFMLWNWNMVHLCACTVCVFTGWDLQFGRGCGNPPPSYSLYPHFYRSDLIPFFTPT